MNPKARTQARYFSDSLTLTLREASHAEPLHARLDPLMVTDGTAAVCRIIDGWSMRRVLTVAAASVALAGCASFSIPGLDSFRPSPVAVTLQLESSPPGAEARTSVGPSCKTPCAVSVPADAPFTVTYTLPRYQPQTVSVQPIQTPGLRSADGTDPGTIDLDPNPAFAELQLAGPAKRPPRRPVAVAKKKSAKSRPATAAAPPQDNSPFPPPPGSTLR